MLAICYLFPTCCLLSIAFIHCLLMSTLLLAWKATHVGCMAQAPWPSGLQLILVIGKHQQEIRGERTKRDWCICSLFLPASVPRLWQGLSHHASMITVLMGSGHRPRGNNDFLPLVSRWLNIQRTVSLSHWGLLWLSFIEWEGGGKREGHTETGKQAEKYTWND